MKKRVRVYQRGGINEFGAEIMPAVRIAQDGAAVQKPQYTDEQLVSVVMSIIGEQGGSPEDALQQLVAAGVDQAKANAVVSSAIEYINQQQGAGQQQAQQQGPTEEEQAQAEEEARMQEQQQEEADRQARYNAQMANDEADLADSEADIDQFASDYIMRNGGALPSKRTFVKNVMKLTKKAAGGQGEQGKADDTDIPGAKGRQAGLQAFVGDLKNKSNNYLQEQDLNAMHAMLSQQMQTPYADPNTYMQEPEMQFGGMRPGQQRRLERRANRMAGMIPSAFFNAHQQMFPQGINIMGMPGMMPGMAAMGPKGFQMPARGLYAGGPRLANIQVHKTGLFGRPKQWTATFDTSGYYDPSQYMRDMARMNQANQQTEYQDVETDKKEEETNTATSENAEVKNEEVKSETNTGGNGTDNTKVKPDTGDDVNDEVKERSGKKPAGDIPETDIYGPWKGAMTDLYDSKNLKRFSKTVKVNGKDVLKHWTYNPRTQEWFREGSKEALTDQKAIDKLNDWFSGLDEEGIKKAGSQPVTGLNPGNPDDYGAQAFAYAVAGSSDLLKGALNLSKYYDQLPAGNNQGLPGVPSSVQQALGQGANPRLLGTGQNTAVGTYLGGNNSVPVMRIGDLRTPDLGSNRTFNAEVPKVETSKPVNLNLTNGESMFQLESGDTKSWFVYKNGKLYKTPKLNTKAPSQQQWYEIKDPERVQNIIGLSGLSPQAFRQMGGMTDQQSQLYRFINGGEDISIPTLNERNTADPYFAYGGYFDGGGMIAINDASGNRKYVTQDEADAWNSAIKDDENLSLNDMSWASESPRQNPNYKAWDDLKTKGVNVGDFREGIDYTKMGQGSQQSFGSNGYYPQTMYNPQIGAMYPPLFGGRRYGPPGAFGYAGSWLKQKGMPFDPITGQMLSQMPTNGPLSKIDVTKSSLLRKRPKEYTLYFGDQGQPVDATGQGKVASDVAQMSEDASPANSRRNRFAERLMHTPGLRKLGAKLYDQPNMPLPEGTTYSEEQMPALTLRDTERPRVSEDLIPDQFNKAGQPQLDLTGLQDAPIPEIIPEEFSFADQQRFGNVQGPLNQEEATGMGSLPMRPLSTIPTQYNDERVPSNFTYTPSQGAANPAAMADLQRFIPQQTGPMVESDYVDQLGFPRPDPMVDITGAPVNTSQMSSPYSVEGPLSNMANIPNQEEFGNEFQGIPATDASNYYQDVMYPNRDRSQYDYMTDQMLTPEELAQQRQDSLDMFTMRNPELSDAPQPWMTQDMVNAQVAKREAARLRQEALIRRQREAESSAIMQQQRGNKNQRTYTDSEGNAMIRDTRGNLVYPTDRGLTEREVSQMNSDFAKAEKARPKLEAKEIKDLGVKHYGNYKKKEDLFKAIYQGHVSSTPLQGVPQSWDESKGMSDYNDKKQALIRLRNEYERWLEQNANQLQNNRRDGGSILPRAQAGAFSSGSASQYGFNYDPNSKDSEENQFNNWWGGLDAQRTNDILAQQERDLQNMGAYDVDLKAEDASLRQLAEDDEPGSQYDFEAKKPWAVKFKVKDMYNVDFEKGVNMGNAWANQGLAWAGELGDRNKGAQRFNNLNSGIYGSTRSRNRGTYETNSGLFRPDEKGFKGVIRDGGNIKRQGGPAYKTGGVTYMSADQVKKFLEEGGELEFV